MRKIFFPKDVRLFNICGAIYDESVLRNAMGNMTYGDIHLESNNLKYSGDLSEDLSTFDFKASAGWKEKLN